LWRFEDKEFEWKTLGDIGDVRMCKRILKNETKSEGDIPFYKIGTFGKQADAFITRAVYDAYKSKYSFPKAGDVLISAAGTIGRAVVHDGKPAYFQDSNIVWLDNDESIVSNRYLRHFYDVAKWYVSTGGTIDRLYNDNIRKTKLPIPFPNDLRKSFAEQARIVSILDKFDALTNSITEGLPREIELRQKQYEYYRDLLLSFPKPEEGAG
jgi:type I restriction enzyme S subunit